MGLHVGMERVYSSATTTIVADIRAKRLFQEPSKRSILNLCWVKYMGLPDLKQLVNHGGRNVN
jgi:hypothetical protein